MGARGGPRRPRIGLALGGGAARGWAHIGVIEALEEAGIVPDVVAGTSMGALVGGAWAAGRMGALKEWALQADRSAVARLVDVSLANGGLIGGARIQDFLEDLGLSVEIGDLPRPYAAVATDLDGGREVWLREGPVAAAIGASIALPGIFTPRRIDGRWLVDGGLVNRVPVSVCRALGADYFIAVNVSEGLVARYAPRAPAPSPLNMRLNDLIGQVPEGLRQTITGLLPPRAPQDAPVPGYFDVLAIALNVMQEKVTQARLAGEPPHVMIAPQVAGLHLLDFHRAPEAIAAGRAAVAEALPALRRGLGVTD